MHTHTLMCKSAYTHTLVHTHTTHTRCPPDFAFDKKLSVENGAFLCPDSLCKKQGLSKEQQAAGEVVIYIFVYVCTRIYDMYIFVRMILCM